jgi:hypothetical protein
MFLADMSGFRTVVREFAGEGHSLSKSPARISPYLRMYWSG